MKSKKVKVQKIIIMLLVVILILPTIAIATQVIATPPEINKQATNGIREQAVQIANMTGKDVEEIIAMQKKGMTWNDILSKFANGKTEEAMEIDTKQISHSQYAKKIEEEGYEQEKIMDKAAFVERLHYDLKELSEWKEKSTIPSTMIQNSLQSDEDKMQEKLKRCDELYQAIDKDLLTYALLKLEQEFLNEEDIIDEYLYALQAELDYELFLSDREAYSQLKGDQPFNGNPLDIITVQVIQALLLEKIQTINLEGNPNTEIDHNPEINNPINEIPNFTPPTTENQVEQMNPTKELQDTLEKLNPNY